MVCLDYKVDFGNPEAIEEAFEGTQEGAIIAEDAEELVGHSRSMTLIMKMKLNRY